MPPWPRHRHRLRDARHSQHRAPAFVVVGAFATWLLNSSFGLDPVLAGLVMAPVFFVLGALLYRLYHVCFERRGDAALQGLAFFFGMLFITEVALVLTAGADYRSVAAPYIGASVSFAGITLPGRMLVPFLVSIAMIGLLHQFLTKTFYGRAIMAVSQDPVALRLMGADPDRIKTIAFGVGRGDSRDRRLAAHHHPAGRAVSIGRDYIGRMFAITCWAAWAASAARSSPASSSA